MTTYTALEFLEQGSGNITICGSTKFFVEVMEVIRIITFKNWMVYSCGSWGHSYHKYAKVHDDHDYAVVKKLHYHKILNSQAIVVVFDKSSYIGDSTKAEIAFATSRDIPIFYFDGEEFYGVTEVKPENELFDISLITQFCNDFGTLGF